MSGFKLAPSRGLRKAIRRKIRQAHDIVRSRPPFMTMLVIDGDKSSFELFTTRERAMKWADENLEGRSFEFFDKAVKG